CCVGKVTRTGGEVLQEAPALWIMEIIAHCLEHRPLVDAILGWIVVRDRDRRRTGPGRLDKRSIHHPDTLSRRREPSAVGSLHLDLGYGAAGLRRTTPRPFGGNRSRDRARLGRFLCHASDYHHCYGNASLQA